MKGAPQSVYEPHGSGGRDPRKMQGNPLVRLTWFKVRAHDWSRGWRKVCRVAGIMVPRGYWMLDNKIKAWVPFGRYYVIFVGLPGGLPPPRSPLGLGAAVRQTPVRDLGGSSPPTRGRGLPSAKPP